MKKKTMTTMVVAGVAYGVMVGSYFGVTPAENTLLAGFKIFDIMDFSFMMSLSIIIGVLHLIVANAITAWDGRRSLKAMGPAGWVFIFLGGVFSQHSYSRIPWDKPLKHENDKDDT